MKCYTTKYLWEEYHLLLSVFLTLVYVYQSKSEENARVVETALGKIVGSSVQVKGTTVYQFLSVPYAKPPTGERRFKKPEPADSWSDPLLATSEPPACIQYTENPFPWYDDQPGKSEDCLFLNIWVPSNAGPGNTKAVFYWIFGGGFFVGSIRQKMYSGEALCSLGDIIVVTVNYRLGSLGFLYSGSSDAPGNAGFWDILAGLQWTKDYINAFGGDSSRITVAGESAGSIAVGLLSISPLSQGLFTRQVMQSGSPAYTVADNNTQNLVRSQRVAKLVGCANDTFTIEDKPTEVVHCLQGIDAMQLSRAEFSLMPHSSRGFLPQYGDEILPENPREAVIAGSFQNKDTLIGNSKDEGSFQITTSNPDIFGFFGEKDPRINKSTGENMLRKMFSFFPDPESVVEHYLPGTVLEDDYEAVRYQVYTASGDFSLVCPTVFFAEKFAESGSKVHFYLWSHRPSTTPWASWMGVPHYSDVEFLFGLPVKDKDSYEADEVGLSMDFIHKWSNFVKHGEPMEQWPYYSKDNPVFLYLEAEGRRSGIGPHRENCDFFRQYFGF